MGAIVVCGGGPVGLCAAMLLARDGHGVTVFERDGVPTPRRPADAWERWTVDAWRSSTSRTPSFPAFA